MNNLRARVGRVAMYPDAESLARASAESFLTLVREAVQSRGRFSVALTGGSSPVQLYRLLGSAPYREQVPWRNVHLFWGDDRVVPPGHPRSNYRLADRLFIQSLQLPAANVHRVRGELGARRAAEQYAAELGDFFAGSPTFDLVYLGLGDDGHVASLFPFDRERLHERRRPVVRSLYRALGEWRVTLTYPVLRAARRTEFLILSPAKAEIARSVMSGPLDPVRLPAQGIRPAGGDLLWRVTAPVAAAAGLMTNTHER